MNLSEIRSKEDVLVLIKERQATHVHIGITDISGQIRGKSISVEKFVSGLERGLPMNANFPIGDFNDVVHAVALDMPKTMEQGEAPCEIVVDSVREIPWEDPRRNLFFLVQYVDDHASIDPRQIYLRIEKRANDLGFRVFHACEFEFTVLCETIQTALEKGFVNLTPYTAVSAFNSTLKHLENAEFFNSLLDLCERIGVGVEASHWEFSPGAGEIVLRYKEGIRAADDAAIYKTFAKVLAKRQNYMLSFMARWNDQVPGNSCHVHISLRDIDGNPVFHDENSENCMSETMRHFLGGMQKAMPEVMLMLAPNYNSFKRFVKGIQTPLASTWGLDNRTAAFRVFIDTPLSQRIENRIGGADANPYLALACVLGAGIWGIENRIEPAEPLQGDCSEQMEAIADELHFPGSFREAIARFRTSEIAKELFGENFIDAFSKTRASQDAIFSNKVTPFEREYFLELS